MIYTLKKELKEKFTEEAAEEIAKIVENEPIRNIYVADLLISYSEVDKKDIYEEDETLIIKELTNTYLLTN